MERYSEYKDSGVKWLGEIPSHWDPSRNKAIFRETKAVVGKNSKNFTLLSLTKKGVIVRNLDEGGKFPAEFDTYKIVEPGDFIFCFFDVDETPRAIGLSTNKGMITGAYTVLNQNTANSRYLYYYYLSIDDAKALKPLYSGLRKTVPLVSFMSMPIFLPPRAEQDAIVRYLDAATSKIDKAIAMQQKMIDLLNERKQIIIQNAVTKGLNENVEMKDSGVEWIGMIPKKWEILKLKRCASIKTGTTPPTNERKYFDGGRISWFTPGDLNDFLLGFASKTITQKAIDDNVGRLFPAKTIYFVGIGATVAKVSACDFAASSNQQINAIICNESLDYRFATYVLKSEQEIIRNMANYVTLPIINQSDTGLIDMIVPPKSEQQAIVAYLDKEMQRFDSAISNCQRQITLLQERKQIIINEVVTGKVKVS